MLYSNMWNYKYLNLKQIICSNVSGTSYLKEYSVFDGSPVRAFENFSGSNNKDFHL